MAPLFHMEALLPGSISPKMSSILQSHVYPRVGRVFRALARLKSLLLDALGKTSSSSKRGGAAPWSSSSSSSRGKKKHDVVISYRSSSTTTTTKTGKSSGLFMMKPRHYSSWAAGGGSSSSSAPAAKGLQDACSCRESTTSAWNVVAAPAGVDDGAGEYCVYLRWLEEEEEEGETPADEEVLVVVEEDQLEDDVDGGNDDDLNEIDRLAEKFIARCHAKFLLEKQESYRRYQEMMARSV